MTNFDLRKKAMNWATARVGIAGGFYHRKKKEKKRK